MREGEAVVDSTFPIAPDDPLSAEEGPPLPRPRPEELMGKVQVSNRSQRHPGWKGGRRKNEGKKREEGERGRKRGKRKSVFREEEEPTRS